MSRSDTQGDDDDEGLSEHEKETRDEARRSAGVKRVSSQSSMDSGTTSLEDAKNKKSKTDSAASSAAARPPKSKKADFSTSYMESQKEKIELQTKMFAEKTALRREEAGNVSRARDREVAVKEKEVEIKEREIDMKRASDEKAMRKDIMMSLIEKGKSMEEIKEYLDLL